MKPSLGFPTAPDAVEAPPGGEKTVDTPGSQLEPSTVETIRDRLEFTRTMRPSWLEYHFPAIAERGTVVYYSDVVGMAPREADSVRDLLATQIRYGRKRVWKRKASRVGLLRDAEDDLDDDWSIRLKQLEEALTDLCEAYSLGNPL